MSELAVHRFTLVLFIAALGCARPTASSPTPSASRFSTDTDATPELVAQMPDTIPCDSAVVVKANRTEEGIRLERRWLDAFYPGHTRYGQALAGSGKRSYDILTFARADGRPASVCFDITSFFGRF